MILKTPVEVYWVLTNRCNLSCSFCMVDARPKSRYKELNLEKKGYVLDEIINNRVLRVCLTGGEPLILPEIPSYIKRLRRNGIGVGLTSNGTLFTKKIANELKEADINWVQLSLNGSYMEINDSLMGPSFKKILKTMELLSQIKIPVRIKVTITRQNILDMEHLVELLSDFRVTDVHLAEVGPMGRGFINRDFLRPSLEDLYSLEAKINSIKNLFKMKIGFSSPTLEIAKEGRVGSCSLGDKNTFSCQILPDGNVIQCALSESLGTKNNILTHGLTGAWGRLEQNRRFLDHSRLNGKCGRCKYKEDCFGGCRALVYLATRDLWAENPFCPYRPIG